jgi:hypothetical protein
MLALSLMTLGALFLMPGTAIVAMVGLVQSNASLHAQRDELAKSLETGQSHLHRHPKGSKDDLFVCLLDGTIC